MLYYHHTQIGRLILVLLFIGFGCTVPLLVLEGQAILISLVVGIVVIIAGLFGSLTVEVTQTDLQFHFGFGLIRRRIALIDIEQWNETHTSFFSGWGIHLTLRGWLYNVSGFSAIEITLKNGKRFVLGTDEPTQLRAALVKAKQTISIHTSHIRHS